MPPRFENLQNRNKCVVVYYVFDCLMLNGNDLRSEPLISRKAVLKEILKKSPLIKLTDHVVEHGINLFSAVEELGLEGIVGKKADSLYVGGRTRDWLKVKTRVGTQAMKKRIETWGR
jgi:bifunctional non-homologous end joining protein LigD